MQDLTILRYPQLALPVRFPPADGFLFLSVTDLAGLHLGRLAGLWMDEGDRLFRPQARAGPDPPPGQGLRAARCSGIWTSPSPREGRC
jgi:hypothetical protein